MRSIPPSLFRSVLAIAVSRSNRLLLSSSSSSFVLSSFSSSSSSSSLSYRYFSSSPSSPSSSPSPSLIDTEKKSDTPSTTPPSPPPPLPPGLEDRPSIPFRERLETLYNTRYQSWYNHIINGGIGGIYYFIIQLSGQFIDFFSSINLLTGEESAFIAGLGSTLLMITTKNYAQKYYYYRPKQVYRSLLRRLNNDPRVLSLLSLSSPSSPSSSSISPAGLIHLSASPIIKTTYNPLRFRYIISGTNNGYRLINSSPPSIRWNFFQWDKKQLFGWERYIKSKRIQLMFEIQPKYQNSNNIINNNINNDNNINNNINNNNNKEGGEIEKNSITTNTPINNNNNNKRLIITADIEMKLSGECRYNRLEAWDPCTNEKIYLEDSMKGVPLYLTNGGELGWGKK